MAGIGFELKKMFYKRGLLVNIKGYLYSFIITLGPFLINTMMLAIMKLILHLNSASYAEDKLFMASVVYAFIFSQLITSGFSMVITRYISDVLYIKAFEKILPAFYGIVIICLSLGSLFPIIFFFKSPLPLFIKFITYILYMQLIIMWIQTVFITALKDYVKISKSFFIGFLLAIISGLIFINYSKLPLVTSLLLGVNLGIFIIVSLLTSHMLSYFKIDKKDTKSSLEDEDLLKNSIEEKFKNGASKKSEGFFKKYFEFLSYFKEYPFLFFTNFFYTLSLYIHNFLFWFSDIGELIENTYRFASFYDVPTFFALITSMPAMVFFVVSIETTFYVKFKNYYSNIVYGGIFTEIENSRKDMLYTLRTELRNIMNLQFIITFILLILGYILLPYIGMTSKMISLFGILTLGSYCNIFILIFILIHLYFENRKGAFIIATTFLITNTLFTKLSIFAGQDYYGLGYLVSTFVSLAIAGITLMIFLKDLDYRTFCSQPIK